MPSSHKNETVVHGLVTAVNKNIEVHGAQKKSPNVPIHILKNWKTGVILKPIENIFSYKCGF